SGGADDLCPSFLCFGPYGSCGAGNLSGSLLPERFQCSQRVHRCDPCDPDLWCADHQNRRGEGGGASSDADGDTAGTFSEITEEGAMDKEYLIREKPMKALLIFAFPMIVGNLFQQFYTMVDSVVVGRFVGENALAAVGASYSLTNVFISIAIGGGMGASVL